MSVFSGDIIPAAVRREAGRLSAYDLFGLGRNSTYGLKDLLEVVLEAAAANSSIEYKAGSPDADTVLYHLKGKLSVEKSEGMLKHFVKRNVELARRRFGGRRFAVAIDYTDEMYYGDSDNPCVVGTKPKAGSSYAFQYFTASIVTDKCRFFLYAYPVFERGNTYVHVERLLALLDELGVRVHVLLMDREFNDSKTILLLTENSVNYITPADNDDRFARAVKTTGKLPALVKGWRIADVAETNLVILDEDGEIFGYFTNLPKGLYEEDAFVLAELYAKRWGIETAHRVEDEFRIRTTTPHGIIRYLFFVISVLIYNIWVWANLNFNPNSKTPILVEEIKDILRQTLKTSSTQTVNAYDWLSRLGDSITRKTVYAPKPQTA